ncbi:hypothetical protein ACFWOJ_31705 [Streptomyces sp. NPDC058439]|uniref:hypothetical protein n=1 Tax=Streptomyces sp. NPDC058439 TaxID=3346500 RepID=UPI003648BA91
MPFSAAGDFPPVINGLDFLESTVELLTERATPSPRNQKYAIVHLAAAFEVVLKARLEIEQPALTWVKPEEFNEVKHSIGDFNSVKWDGTLKLVRKHCAPETKLIDKLQIKALVDMRNRIAHFGFAEETAAVEVVTTPVLDFLVTFVHDDLLPLVSEGQVTRAEEILERIRPGLGKIKALVDQRLKPARELQAKHLAHIIRCRICASYSVPILGGDATIACVVCHADFGTPTEAAWAYADANEYMVVTGGGESPVLEHQGFYCDGAATHVPAGETADGAETTILLCLTCGEDCAGVCDYCGRAVTSFAFEEAQMCSDCMDNKLARF